MAIYRSGNSFSDRDTTFGPAGERLTNAIRALTVGNRRRVTGRSLDPSGEPAAVGPERTTVVRDVGGDAAAGGGFGLPLTEIERQVEQVTVYDPYDPTAYIVFEQATVSSMQDAAGNEGTITWLSD